MIGLLKEASECETLSVSDDCGLLQAGLQWVRTCHRLQGAFGGPENCSSASRLPSPNSHFSPTCESPQHSAHEKTENKEKIRKIILRLSSISSDYRCHGNGNPKILFWSIGLEKKKSHLLFKVPGISGEFQGHPEIWGDDATAGQVRDDRSSSYCTVCRQDRLYVFPHKRAWRWITQREKEARKTFIRYYPPHLSWLSWTGGVKERLLSSKRLIIKKKNPQFYPVVFLETQHACCVTQPCQPPSPRSGSLRWWRHEDQRRDLCSHYCNAAPHIILRLAP